MSDDLFPGQTPERPKRERAAKAAELYDAAQIEVLEGLEPVRRRPGMYIGGTDDAAYHHLASEIIDNAMDEAVAGFADIIEVSLEASNTLFVRDNGRGIPVDPHPKFKDRSALEVIFTTLHAGGKFSGKAYQTSGGLHGVGSSVVNALSSFLEVEVTRDRTLWRQTYARGVPQTPLEKIGKASGRSGTTVRFTPDQQIFGNLGFSADRLYRLCRSKASLFRNVTINWKLAPDWPRKGDETPETDIIHFPNGLADSLITELESPETLLAPLWAGEAQLPKSASGEDNGRVEWAIAFITRGTATIASFCNTIPTPQGGTHEIGLRAALLKGFRHWGEQRSMKRAAMITADDIMGMVACKLSIFIRDPHFQGQTKEKLTTQEAARLVEGALRDRIDHWLGGNPAQADQLLAAIIDRAEERLRRKESRDTLRKSATRRLRLPGKLTDCTRENAAETEIFLVEGDSAGGSARQARDRETQAVLPLRGKILNVASATAEKLRANQELKDLVEALGAGIGGQFEVDRLRYGRVIIMTDADVDGAHIASLLMTFFYREMPRLIEGGHLYLAQPPLYRLTHGPKTVYAMNDDDRDRCIKRDFKPNARVEISRFKGLGEMPVSDLKKTTMDPRHRTMLRVIVPREDESLTRNQVESLMGRKPELRFQFIQERARFVEMLDI